MLFFLFLYLYIRKVCVHVHLRRAVFTWNHKQSQRICVWVSICMVQSHCTKIEFEMPSTFTFRVIAIIIHLVVFVYLRNRLTNTLLEHHFTVAVCVCFFSLPHTHTHKNPVACTQHTYTHHLKWSAWRVYSMPFAFSFSFSHGSTTICNSYTVGFYCQMSFYIASSHYFPYIFSPFFIAFYCSQMRWYFDHLNGITYIYIYISSHSNGNFLGIRIDGITYHKNYKPSHRYCWKKNGNILAIDFAIVTHEYLVQT